MALGDDVKQLRAELREMQKEVADLRRFQSWVMGAAAGVGAIFAFLVEGLKSRLGL